MTKKILTAFTFVLLFSKIIGQNYYTISFDGASNGESATGHRLYIDKIANPNNVWQIGHPSKTVFTNAATNPNAIVTDTLNTYPINSTSSFIVQHIASAGFTMGSGNGGLVSIGGQYYVNSDTLTDYGKIEFSPDNGSTWVDLLTTTTYSNYVHSNNNPYPKPVLSGNSNLWQSFSIEMSGLGNALGVHYGDTVMWRFTFISDATQTNKDGLMFDNLKVFDTPPVGIENFSLSNFAAEIYPNPASTQFLINANTTETSQVDVYDVNGKLVFSKAINNNEVIDVASLNQGVYTVSIKNSNLVVNKKLVILR